MRGDSSQMTYRLQIVPYLFDRFRDYSNRSDWSLVHLKAKSHHGKKIAWLSHSSLWPLVSPIRIGVDSSLLCLSDRHWSEPPRVAVDRCIRPGSEETNGLRLVRANRDDTQWGWVVSVQRTDYSQPVDARRRKNQENQVVTQVDRMTWTWSLLLMLHLERNQRPLTSRRQDWDREAASVNVTRCSKLFQQDRKGR